MRTNRLTSQFANQSNMTRTENNAETFRSTKNPVLDFFYLSPANQGGDNLPLFLAAYEHDPVLALKALFYLRDIRQGKGQRKTFRDILAWLADDERRVFKAIVPYVPEYGRWDDITPFVRSSVVRNLIKDQLIADTETGKNPTLLGKWMPSANTSSEATRTLARQWMQALDMSPRDYRKLLSALRQRIDVVERKMSAKEWGDINYSRVPSKAMKKYRKAFKKQDDERFSAFIEKALTGEVKINSSTLYPHDIVMQFMTQSGTDKVLEAMWSQLPNYFGEEERNVLVMVDVSGSMGATISGKLQAIHVSIALGLYCAERNRGAFHNYFMTFSGQPAIQAITGKTLRTRINELHRAHWDMNTDIQAAFRSLLDTAIRANVPAEDMPTNIVIISDMEFDECVSGGTNFENIQRQYQRAGYELPLVTFWNVNARNKQTPVTKNEHGVFLVSGFSAETIGKVLNSKAVDPEELMLEVLNSERYAFVDELGI